MVGPEYLVLSHFSCLTSHLHPFPWESWKSFWISCAHSSFSADPWAGPWESTWGMCHPADQKPQVSMMLDSFWLQGRDVLRMFWDLFQGRSGNGEKQKTVLIPALLDSKTGHDIWDVDRGSGYNMVYLIVAYLGWCFLLWRFIYFCLSFRCLVLLTHSALYLVGLVYSWLLCIAFFKVSFSVSSASVFLCAWHLDLLREGLQAVSILDGMVPPSFGSGPRPGAWVNEEVIAFRTDAKPWSNQL